MREVRQRDHAASNMYTHYKNVVHYDKFRDDLTPVSWGLVKSWLMEYNKVIERKGQVFTF